MEHPGSGEHALGGQALEGRSVEDRVDGALGPRGAKVVLNDVNDAGAIQARARELREAPSDDASDRGRDHDVPPRGSGRKSSRPGHDRAAYDPPDPGRSPEQLVANSRLRGRLQTALRDLPPSQRAIVFLREMQGLSTREVAHAMGISEDNVKTRLSRARKALQTALEGPAR